MLPGETISSGAPATCSDCNKSVVLDIYLSGGGYYVGTYCDCGPYSRESEYYPTRAMAEMAMSSGYYGRF